LKVGCFIQAATKDEITKANIDVIELLLAAQQHNAQQLAKFCLHFIATNYGPMKQRPGIFDLSFVLFSICCCCCCLL
jgi:hypothetical protein